MVKLGMELWLGGCVSYNFVNGQDLLFMFAGYIVAAVEALIESSCLSR